MALVLQPADVVVVAWALGAVGDAEGEPQVAGLADSGAAVVGSCPATVHFQCVR